MVGLGRESSHTNGPSHVCFFFVKNPDVWWLNVLSQHQSNMSHQFSITSYVKSGSHVPEAHGCDGAILWDSGGSLEQAQVGTRASWRFNQRICHVSSTFNYFWMYSGWFFLRLLWKTRSGPQMLNSSMVFEMIANWHSQALHHQMWMRFLLRWKRPKKLKRPRWCCSWPHWDHGKEKNTNMGFP